jgi:lipoate-protein ligase B
VPPAALRVRWLGTVPYAEALKLQREAVAALRRGEGEDTLFLLEHPPVVTLGRGSHPEHLLLSREALAREGVELCEADRGGDVTYHAPGQLVGYPVLDLTRRGGRDLHRYLRRLEALLRDALAELRVPAATLAGRTGVFVADAGGAATRRKIASIGVGAKGWITCHGFALNVDLDLAGFRHIVPCGLHDVEMTSVARELGAPAPGLAERARAAVRAACEAHFA